MRSQEPRSSSSCAACKLLKRKCTPHCLFAPYFRADEPKKFAKVHKVFGASNVTKILNEVPEPQREDAVNSLVFEAEQRLKDPVYGCIGAIANLQGKMFQLQHDLAVAKARLARCSSAKAKAKAKPPSANSSTSNWSSTASPFLILEGHDDDQFGMTSSSFDELMICSGMVSGFTQNSVDQMDQAGSMNQLHQLPFP